MILDYDTRKRYITLPHSFAGMRIATCWSRVVQHSANRTHSPTRFWRDFLKFPLLVASRLSSQPHLNSKTLALWTDVPNACGSMEVNHRPTFRSRSNRSLPQSKFAGTSGTILLETQTQLVKLLELTFGRPTTVWCSQLDVLLISKVAYSFHCWILVPVCSDTSQSGVTRCET